MHSATPGDMTDRAYQKRLADERRERCRVLWNAVRHLVAKAESPTPDNLDVAVAERERLLRIANVALEGGPLGHQGDLEDGVDVLTLDDLERSSGAISHPDVRGKPCPGCGMLPSTEVERYLGSDRPSGFAACEQCGIRTPTVAAADVAKVWNAVVDAWNGGFATAQQPE